MSAIIAAVGGGLALSAVGGIISSNAQANTAESQLGEATVERQQALGFAGATPAELASQQSQLGMATQSLQLAQDQMGQYALMQSQLSPTFSAAFGQIQGLLGGQQVGYTSPYFTQLNIQRQQMNNQLQGAMGTGYGSSTAGTQAQALFAQQAGMGAMGVTQNALSTLGGLGSQAGGMIQSLGNSSMGMLQGAAGINQGYAGMLGNIQNREIQASIGSSTTQYQGAQYAGSMGLGNTLGGLGTGIAAGAGSIYGANQLSNLGAMFGSGQTVGQLGSNINSLGTSIDSMQAPQLGSSAGFSGGGASSASFR